MARLITAASVLLLAVVMFLPGAAPVQAAGRLAGQPPPHDQQPGREPGTAAVPPVEAPAHATTDQAAHGTGVMDLVARLTNFAILAGALVYLLRSPLATYLASRAAAVRKDLVDAHALRTSATEQLHHIDEQLRALPGEIEALRVRGAQEIAAEEARIAQAAAIERERLLEQTRREIELQLRIARQQLIAEAAELAVGVASDRIKRNITDQDQIRLVDRYLEQVSPRHE